MGRDKNRIIDWNRKNHCRKGVQIMEYHSSAPYPPVSVSRRNPQVLPLLYGLYANRSGELTALTGYVYQNLLIFGSKPEIAEALLHIAVVEMRHLHMLGQLIVLSGGEPAFLDRQSKRPWSGAYPSRQKNVCLFLLEDLENEIQAADAYIATANQIEDPKIKAVLMRIAADETVHVQVLKKLIADCRCNPARRK